jgi:hypothetical protein
VATPEGSARTRRNKRYGAAVEARFAAALGTKRYPANTGGSLDLIPIDGMYIQVKGGKTVVTAIMRDALAKARAAAAAHNGLPAVAIEDRRGPRYQRWICFPFEEWCAWNGYGKEATA